MGTTLLLGAANVAAAPLRRAVPPQVWPGRLHRLMWADGHCAIELGALTDAREILPCLSVRSAAAWGYQCTLEYATASGHSLGCVRPCRLILAIILRLIDLILLTLLVLFAGLSSGGNFQ